jgi:hypothetical protein
MAKHLEIERKYLLKSLPELKYHKILHIFQYYLPDGSRIRETRDGNPSKGHFKGTTIPFPFGPTLKCERVIKKKLKPGVYEEDEKEISKNKYANLCGTAISVIQKTRYIYKMEKLKWEIDVYRNITMVTAEIELPKEGAPFKIPEALKKVMVMDVTEFPQFTNRALSNNK